MLFLMMTKSSIRLSQNFCKFGKISFFYQRAIIRVLFKEKIETKLQADYSRGIHLVSKVAPNPGIVGQQAWGFFNVNHALKIFLRNILMWCLEVQKIDVVQTNYCQIFFAAALFLL